MLLYGERQLAEVNTGEGTRLMNVIEFIDFCLKNDNLKFSCPEYQTILDEAAQHSKEDGFIPSKYFLFHTNQQISKIAAALESEKYQLRESQRNTVEKIEDKLYDVVPDAINRFRISYVKEEENRVLAEMQKPEIAADKGKRFQENITQNSKP